MPFPKEQKHPGPENSPLSRWQFPLVVIPIFGVYLSTLNPALFRNDSPETITACWTLGVSHPPGYPLHTLLGRLLALSPVGNPAMTINLFSALLGALSAYVFFLNAVSIISSMLKTRTWISFPSALLGTFCFAFSKSFWSVSLAAKGGIYNFQVLLELSLLLYIQYWLSHRADRGSFGSARHFYFLIFLFTLGLTDHWPTHLLLVTALAVGIIATKAWLLFRGTGKPWKKLWTASSLALIVLSLYLYLPLRSHLAPTLDFGDPSTFRNLFSSIFRTQYFKTETLASFIPTALSTMQDKSIYISEHFKNEFSILFPFLVLLGIWALWKNNSRIELFFLVGVTGITFFSNVLYLKVAPIEYWHMDDHLLTINWSVALLGTLGLAYLWTFATKRRAWVKAFGILALLLPLLTLQKNLTLNDQKGEFLYRGYGVEALRSMDRNADYFAESDYDYFSILYLRDVEKKREDIGLSLTTFMGEKDWRDLQEWAGMRPNNLRPKYCAFSNGDFIRGYLNHAPKASLMPTGTLVRFMPTQEAFKKGPDQEPLGELWQRYLTPDRRSLNPINNWLIELCAHPYLNMANYLKLRGSWDHWGPYHAQALGLIQDPDWQWATFQEMSQAGTPPKP